jgi:uncharacterized protein YjbJ (UPF0337 family)
MNRKSGYGYRAAPVNDGWAQLVEDDAIGIDGDIERLVGLYQAKYGCTRDKANAELVRRLSSLARPDAAPSEDSCCS